MSDKGKQLFKDRGMFEKSDKSKAVAFWLCIIFGPAGLHRFYVGRILSGLVMLTPSIFCFVWASKKFDQVFGSASALLGANQTHQSNSFSVLGGLTNQVNDLAASHNLDFSRWDTFMGWLTFGLVAWALIDLMVIVAGQFKDKDGRTL